MQHQFKRRSLIKLIPYILLISIIFITCKKNDKGSNTNETLPVIANATVSDVNTSRATITANITSDGGKQITEEGVCYDTLPNPTTAGKKQKIDTLKSGSFSIRLQGLSPNTKYYARAYAINSVGTAYSNEVNFTIQTVAIGDFYEGGIIFYIDPTGKHGLVSAEEGVGLSGPWGCKGVNIPGLGTEVGSGKANTKAIIAVCKQTGNAALLCDDLVHNGFNDWFMPSKDELALMYLHRNLIGFNDAERWSSSQLNADSAWAHGFGSSTPDPVSLDKSTVQGVRAIRAF